METFQVTKVYADEQGDTHFETVQYPLTDAGPIGFLSEKLPVRDVIFREVTADYDFDFHTAPQRQFIILLDGRIEIETSLGDKRIFEAGEILQMEDLTGKGHRTRNLLNAKRKSVFITF